MKFKFLTSPLIFILCCSFFGSKPDGRIALKILKSYSKKIEKSTGLELRGIGGVDANDVKVIRAYYGSNEQLNLDKARSLYVQTLQNFLDEINANEDVRPYLHNYPFDSKNLNFSIAFLDNRDHFYENGYIASIMMSKGKIFYDIYKDKMLTEIHEENYSDALKIVQNAKNPETPIQ